MATQMGFYVIPGRCVQCQACKVACKEMNEVELGPQWRKVADHWSGEFPKVRNIAISYSCMHCEKPACRDVCPVGAITKRESDGIVVVNQKECIACHACERACPYNAPQYGRNGKMQKCNFCLDQVSQGKQPACVSTCPGEAIGFGNIEELKKLTASGAVRLPGSTEPAFFIVPAANMGARPEEYVKTFFKRA